MKPTTKELSTREIAELLSVNPSTVQRWVAKGLPCEIASHGQFRFHEQTVRRWLKAERARWEQRGKQ